MIAHAFDILSDEMQMHAGRDIARIFHHKRSKLPEHSVIQLVNITVF